MRTGVRVGLLVAMTLVLILGLVGPQRDFGFTVGFVSAGTVALALDGLFPPR